MVKSTVNSEMGARLSERSRKIVSQGQHANRRCDRLHCDGPSPRSLRLRDRRGSRQVESVMGSRHGVSQRRAVNPAVCRLGRPPLKTARGRIPGGNLAGLAPLQLYPVADTRVFCDRARAYSPASVGRLRWRRSESIRHRADLRRRPDSRESPNQPASRRSEPLRETGSGPDDRRCRCSLL